MSEELTIELAVCSECYEIWQSALYGSPCLSSECDGEYERVKFRAEVDK